MIPHRIIRSALYDLRLPVIIMVPARLMRDDVKTAGVIGVEIAGVVWGIGWEDVVRMWSGVAKYFLKSQWKMIMLILFYLG